MQIVIPLILNFSRRLFVVFIIFVVLKIQVLFLPAQVNLVPNPGFEEVSDCDIDFGQADKAQPWQIINKPVTSPDLYHICSSNPFFITPSGNCGDPIFPNSGDGMVGLVTNVSNAEERIYVRLLNKLPQDIDIYVAYSILPRSKCEVPMEFICYSNSQCLAFSDFQFQSRRVVLESDTIVYETEFWTKMETCYIADGTEDLVLIGNYKNATATMLDCDYINPEINYAYFYVDDVVVSPFDVVPDTIFLCGDDMIDIDVTFYDVPIRWSDGVTGPIRTLSKEGSYMVYGDLEECSLTDHTIVIKIPEIYEPVEFTICDNQMLILEAPIPAQWPDGSISPTYNITHPGRYKADLLNECGNRQIEYIVSRTECNIEYYVPNVFSPNGDGINDILEFFFSHEFAFSGTLSVFDRWGNLVFSTIHDSSGSTPKWDGSFRGKPLVSGVFVWQYKYTSTKDGLTKFIHGDVLLIR